jgi:hypothetical protein
MSVLEQCGLAHFEIMTGVATAAYLFDVDCPRHVARNRKPLNMDGSDPFEVL